MTSIPKDAREVYCNQKGEPIAWCPKDSLGLTDIERAQFFSLNEVRLRQLAARAREKGREGKETFIALSASTWTIPHGHPWSMR